MARRRSLMSMGFATEAAKHMVGTVGTLTAAGSSSADAAAIVNTYTNVNAGTGGVICPVLDVGDSIMVLNTSGSTITVYPSTGNINGSSSLSLGNNKSVQVWGESATSCRTNPVTPS